MPGAWLKMLTEGQAARVVRGFERAIAESFKTDNLLVLVQTSDEVRRRYRICERVFEELRADANWSLPRIMDELPRILRCELDGTPWNVDGRASWGRRVAG